MRFHLASLAPAAALLAPAAALPAQTSHNVKLLANFDPDKSSPQPYNDIWGYVNPANGKEYAIFGTDRGTYVVDCSIPTRPVQRGFFPYTLSPGWRVSLWRDMKTYGPWLYVVQERGGRGMQIIDLRDPDRPKYVKTWGAGWGNAHNIAMDQSRGIAVVVGNGSSSWLIDVKTDPQNPRLLSRYIGNYQHDVSLQHGWMYGAAIWAGTLEVFDISNPKSILRLASVKTPRKFAHATWPTWDDRYCVVTDEWYRGPLNGGLSVWDVTNKRIPKLVAQFKAGPALAIAHNAFIRDYVVHMSHYTEGYRTLDISDPTKPVEVGFYDTWPKPVSGTGDFNGNWGLYHAQPSGVIYLTDRTTGLYVVKPRSSSAFYGAGTPGTGGVRPRIHTTGCGYLGNARFQLGVRDARPASPAVVVLGGRRANLSLGGLMLHVALQNPAPVLAGLATGAKGTALVPLPVPLDPKLQGVVLDAQFFVADPKGKLGFASTQGMEFELFAK